MDSKPISKGVLCRDFMLLVRGSVAFTLMHVMSTDSYLVLVLCCMSDFATLTEHDNFPCPFDLINNLHQVSGNYQEMSPINVEAFLSH